jgi:hypothetical protein
LSQSTNVIFTDFRVRVELLLSAGSCKAERGLKRIKMRETEHAGERRKGKRFRLRLAVLFSWRDAQGLLQSGEGWSRNIGSRGVYVRTNTAPPIGTLLEMNIFLPELGYKIHTAEIHAKGQVARIDCELIGQACGFAAVNQSIVIREAIGFEKKKANTEHRFRVA